MARIKSELHGFDKEHNGQSKTTELANKVEKTIKKETRETKLEVEENETENIKLLGYSFFYVKYMYGLLLYFM